MRTLDFPVTESRDQDGEVFSIPTPNIASDKMIPLNTEGRRQLGVRLGDPPGRASLSRWRKHGYPVDRDGPRVKLPYVVKVKRVYTTTKALYQFLQLVQWLQEQIQEAGSITRWRAGRKRR